MASTLTFIPRNVALFLRPRSTNPDQAFRERTIRVAASLLLVITILSIVASLTIYGNSWKLASYPTILAIMGVILIGVLIMLERQQISAAGILLIIAFLEAMCGILLIEGYWAFLILPILMLTLIIAAMVLPNRLLWLTGLIGVVLIGVLSELQLQSGFHIAIAAYTVPAFLTNCGFVCLTELIALTAIQTEAASRLSALNIATIEKDEANRQRLVAMQQAVDEADKANRLKSQFLASMSHELRTPLNAIIGYTEIMLSGMAGNFTEKQNELHQHVHTNARRLLGLINDILDLARIESGKVEVHTASAEPRKFVGEIVDSMQSLAQKNNIYLKLSPLPTTPDNVVCDVQKVQQIVTNLIGNALKFTTQGGVDVEVAAPDKDTWSIKVKDSGRGMPPEAVNYIFDMFRQVDASDARQHGGSGLGLAITRRLVERLNGKIAVETTLGVGSAFTVTLPRVFKETEKAA